MKSIRKRITYANVMSSIAVFLVLGGASALAASHLGKNSVGSKQLKKNAVTTAKIKNDAVTTSKIKNGAVSGAKINLGSLGTVPSASHATTADSAGRANSADSAGNANTVGGQSVTKVFKTLLPGQSDVTVASIAGFTFKASCEELNIDVTLTAPNSTGSVLSAQGNGEYEGPYFEYESAKAGHTDEIRLDNTTTPNPEGDVFGHASFSGALSNSTVISGELAYDYGTFGNESPERCIVFGEVTSG